MLFLLFAQVCCADNGNNAPPPNAVVESVLKVDGKKYELINGKLYEISSSDKKKFILKMYEPRHIEETYKKEKDGIHRMISPSEKYLVPDSHTESFEGDGDLVSLFEQRDYWTSMTLLSPATPTVKSYVELRKKIMNREADFIDNSLTLTKERAHQGERSLKCLSVDPTGRGKTSWITKASLDTGLVYYERGDTVIFSSYFYLEQGVPTGIVDIEASYVNEGPGVRILFSEDLRPRVELKWADKPTWRIPKSVDYKFPLKKWVFVELKVFLSEDQQGSVEMKIDGKTLIKGKGQTLPFAKAVYDRMEVGITANGSGDCILFVDEVQTKRLSGK